ncbi:hypothetical protein WJX72_010403 [[Myrmecia] bisecta]|uniref:Rubisco LSMT substrate-binding domain-containing protein n=1 Tax=[Myrmecia] bisecta TaxID=41462 RepID=A0AAW1QSA5_9CHLO
MHRWLIETKRMPPQLVEPRVGLGYVALRGTREGEVILDLPGDLAITGVDADNHPLISTVAEGRSELVKLALWLMAERSQGAASSWAPFLAALPQRSASPILWSSEERQQLLRGSPTLPEAESRAAALESEWTALAEAFQQERQLNSDAFTKTAFFDAMSVVLATATYLPAAQCFALLPIANLLRRTGNEDGASLDYNLETGSVNLTATQPYRENQEVLIFDGRPNSELFLATGMLEDSNQSNCLLFEASLVAADRLFMLKKQILESVGFASPMEFPVYQDRMPVQLLAYARLARVQDAGELAKVTFDRDVAISPANEYEVLQLLLGDCRERLSAYPTSIEEDVKLLQNRSLPAKQRLAARLCLAEKRIIQSTMDAVRRRLAPIRGIPTKGGGMRDPNSDLKEIFDAFESIPEQPKKFLEGIKSWARGDLDPTWKKRK